MLMYYSLWSVWASQVCDSFTFKYIGHYPGYGKITLAACFGSKTPLQANSVLTPLWSSSDKGWQHKLALANTGGTSANGTYLLGISAGLAECGKENAVFKQP